MTDGHYPPGQALPITKARLQVAGFDQTREPDASGQSVTFEADLKKGPVELQTWMLSQDNQPICGAYYVYVKRLD